jgi:hypothetical protein
LLPAGAVVGAAVGGLGWGSALADEAAAPASPFDTLTELPVRASSFRSECDVICRAAGSLVCISARCVQDDVIEKLEAIKAIKARAKRALTARDLAAAEEAYTQCVALARTVDQMHIGGELNNLAEVCRLQVRGDRTARPRRRRRRCCCCGRGGAEQRGGR